MKCNICKIEVEYLEIIAPPIEKISSEVLKINGISVVFEEDFKFFKTAEQLRAGIIPENEVELWRYWSICKYCADLIRNKYLKIILPFKLSEEMVQKILKAGPETFICNSKQLELSKKNKYRKYKKRKK